MNIKSTGVTLAGATMLVASAITSAEPVTFEISATVYNVYDSAYALQGSVAMGDKITGTYTIDISAPDNDPNFEYGHYIFDVNTPANPQLGFDLIVNSHSLKSDPTVSGHMYQAYTMNSYSDHFGLSSWGNVPLSNGTKVDDIFMDLYDPSGQALSSDALSNQAPNVTAFEIHDLHISGSSSNYDYYYIDAKIDSIQVAGAACSPDQNPVTFNVTAQVREIYDYDNVLGSTVNIGDSVTGSYTFNTNTPDMDPAPEYGRFEHVPGTGNYGFNISVANFNLKTDPNNDMFAITMADNPSWSDYYFADQFGTQIPFINGSFVESMGLNIEDPSGSLITNVSLTGNPPSLNTTGMKELFISGMRNEATYTAYYTIVADLISITNANACSEQEPVVVSPAGGIFDRYQNFDAAIILEPGLAPLMNMEAKLNGFDITPQLYSCNPGAINNQNRQTLVCPGFSGLLTPGNNILTFTFILEDGRVSNYTTDWYILGDWY